MNTFYTVDRLNSLKENQIIELTKFNDISPIELQRHVDELFPNGVTVHGDKYFLNDKSSPGMANSQIEILLEYVRRANFSSQPSRFQSFFAVDSLVDAQTFALKYGEGTIWEVQAENYFKADMSFLTQPSSVLVYSYYFDKYWKGEASTNPFWEYLLKPPIKIVKKITLES